MNLANTLSEENVRDAFAKEAQARTKYTYYAEVAALEGHSDIAALFRKMADNELEHARIWFKLMNGGGMDDTVSNLVDASSCENAEWKNMYPAFAATARDEGLNTLATMFERVAAIENDHERRFLEALLQLKAAQGGAGVVDADATGATPLLGEALARAATVVGGAGSGTGGAAALPYRCMFCGATAQTGLEICPVCEAVGAYERVG